MTARATRARVSSTERGSRRHAAMVPNCQAARPLNRLFSHNAERKRVVLPSRRVVLAFLVTTERRLFRHDRPAIRFIPSTHRRSWEGWIGSHLYDSSLHYNDFLEYSDNFILSDHSHSLIQCYANISLALGEGNGAFSALCLLLVGEVASENLAIFAANVLGIFIVQLLKKCPR